MAMDSRNDFSFVEDFSSSFHAWSCNVVIPPNLSLVWCCLNYRIDASNPILLLLYTRAEEIQRFSRSEYAKKLCFFLVGQLELFQGRSFVTDADNRLIEFELALLFSPCDVPCVVTEGFQKSLTIIIIIATATTVRPKNPLQKNKRSFVKGAIEEGKKQGTTGWRMKENRSYQPTKLDF